MKTHEIGTKRTSRTTSRSAIASPTKPQRVRVSVRTYWRRLAASSCASCASMDVHSSMRGNLHPEQVARLEEKAVAGAAEVPEGERLGLVERGAVAEEEHRSRGRLERKQGVVAEVVGRLRPGGRPVHDERLAGAGILERDPILGEVLADVAEKDRSRELIFDLHARDVSGREAAAVPGSGEAQVRRADADPNRRGGSPAGRRGECELVSLGRLGEDRCRAVTRGR